MHEMALTREVVETVLEVAEEADAAKVTSVTLTIGCCRDIVEDWFVGLFAHLVKGTMAEGAELVINRTPYKARCNQCGDVYSLEVFDESTWPCPSCNVKNYTVVSGREFRIDHIGAVPKEQARIAACCTG